MAKVYRKAVRVFIFDDNYKKVLTIKYTSLENLIDYYDIPGGGIEKNETSIEAAHREVAEETGKLIKNIKYSGNLIIEYPNIIYDLDIYTTKSIIGDTKMIEDNEVLWIDINKLLKEEKILSVITLLNNDHINDLLSNNNFKLHFIVDKNNKKTKEKEVTI